MYYKNQYSTGDGKRSRTAQRPVWPLIFNVSFQRSQLIDVTRFNSETLQFSSCNIKQRAKILPISCVCQSKYYASEQHLRLLQNITTFNFTCTFTSKCGSISLFLMLKELLQVSLWMPVWSIKYLSPLCHINWCRLIFESLLTRSLILF